MNRRTIRPHLVSIGAVVCSLGLLADARQAPQAPAQPLFRSAVDHVSVDVVVTDGKNAPISDLTKGDFTITEHDTPQTIADFQYIAIPVQPRTIDAVAARHAPQVDVVTNAPPSSISRALVMVIDDLHLIEKDILPVKQIITEFVDALAPDDEAAIVFTGRSDLGVDLTRDVARLLGTADHVRDAMGFGLDAAGATTPNGPAIGGVITANARSADYVLKNVSAALAGSGFARRAIIYVSGGSIAPSEPGMPPPWPFAPASAQAMTAVQSDQPYLKEAYDASHYADTPIYTIDPRGLVQPEEAIRGGIGSIGGIGRTNGSQQRAGVADNIRRQQDRLVENAINTGGRAFVNQNDLPRAVDELMADSGHFYLLGYYPSPYLADGQFHPITVSVNRPGAHVRARAGYMAAAAADVGTESRASIESVLGAGESIAGVSLHVFAAPVAPSATGMSTVVTAEVTYPATAPDARTVTDDMLLMVVALDPNGKIKARSENALQFTGEASDRGPVSFLVNDLVDLPAQPLELRVGVSSRALNKTGTVQIPIEVPKLSADSLQLGGVVLGVEKSTEPAQRFEAIRDVVPFQPTTTRAFASTDTLRVLAPVFWGGTATTLTARVSVPGAAGIHPQELTLTGVSTTPGHWQATIDARVPLSGLTAGAYGLQVDARLANGQPVSRLLAFDVK